MGRASRCNRGKSDVHVEALGLEGGETIRDGEELLAHRGQMLQTLLEAEIAQVVGADLIAQEGGELLVLLCVQRRLAYSVGGLVPPRQSQKPRSLGSKEEGN